MALAGDVEMSPAPGRAEKPVSSSSSVTVSTVRAEARTQQTGDRVCVGMVQPARAKIGAWVWEIDDPFCHLYPSGSGRCWVLGAR